MLPIYSISFTDELFVICDLPHDNFYLYLLICFIQWIKILLFFAFVFFVTVRGDIILGII
jgi:hypothetical protein